MDKRFTRSAALFSTMFLTMLIFAVVAFFYGMNLGSKQVENKYAYLKEGKNEPEAYTYQQQDLVSFYHTVFVPTRAFHNDWHEAITKISNNEVSNISSVFKELEGQASKKAKDAGSFNLQHAALLGEAQQSYIRSLNQFEKLAGIIQKKGNSLNYEKLISLLENENSYEVAVSQSLKAQKAYYDAMYLWASSIDPEIPTNFQNSTNQSIDNWKTFPMVIKNSIVSSFLVNQSQFVNFYPHDLVSNIDNFIESGQINTMNITDVRSIIDLLLNTGAVRAGDYNQSKNKLYSHEFLPQIPLFYPVVK